MFTTQVDPDAAIAEITHRLATKRLKVFSTCTQLLAQYRAYRRDKEGEVVEEADGLMRAMYLLVIEAPRFAASDDQAVQESQDEWADQTRNSLTGY